MVPLGLFYSLSLLFAVEHSRLFGVDQSLLGNNGPNLLGAQEQCSPSFVIASNVIAGGAIAALLSHLAPSSYFSYESDKPIDCGTRGSVGVVEWLI